MRGFPPRTTFLGVAQIFCSLLGRVGRRTMATRDVEETGLLETDAVLVRTMRQDDLNVIVAIDAAASGRRRPRYFELMLQRSITQAGLQISLVAELDNRVVGFVIGSLYYGEYGVAEPSASIDAISVDARVRGKKCRQGADATVAPQS